MGFQEELRPEIVFDATKHSYIRTIRPKKKENELSEHEAKANSAEMKRAKERDKEKNNLAQQNCEETNRNVEFSFSIVNKTLKIRTF